MKEKLHLETKSRGLHWLWQNQLEVSTLLANVYLVGVPECNSLSVFQVCNEGNHVVFTPLKCNAINSNTGTITCFAPGIGGTYVKCFEE